jgi:hypothetical protein
MKPSVSNHYVEGVMLSTLSMAVSLVVSLVVYPIYWKVLPRSEFVTWFATFEFSQFFLLLDIGFTQSFIKKCAGENTAEIEEGYMVLRGTMLLVAAFALIVQLPAFALAAAPESSSAAVPYIFLAASTAITIWSYAETAALRVLLDFRAIYTINIGSNAVFLSVAYFGREFGLFAIAGACLIRAVLQNFAQIALLSRKLRIATICCPQFDGVGSSFLMNSAYLIVFSLDAVIFNRMGVKASDVSSFILNRKIYDVFRGVTDAAMNVVAIRLASSRPVRLVNFVVLIVCVGVSLSFFLARPALHMLFAQGVFQFDLSRWYWPS